MEQPTANDIEQLGARLSKEISCGVKYPAFDKNVFICMCKVTFPVYIVRRGNWDLVRRMHSGTANTDKKENS